MEITGIARKLVEGIKSLTGLETSTAQDQTEDASSRNPHKSAQKRQPSHDPTTNNGHPPDDHSRLESAQNNRRHEINRVSRNTMTASNRSKTRDPNYVSHTVKPFLDRKPRKWGGTFKPQNSLSKNPYTPGTTQSYGRRGNKNIYGTLDLESTRGDNVAHRANRDSEKEFQEPATKRRRVTLGSQPTRRATDDSDDLTCDGHVVAVGGRTLQSSPIKRGSAGFVQSHGHPVFRNIHSASTGRKPHSGVVDLDDDNEDILVSSPPTSSHVDPGRRRSTSRNSIDGVELMISNGPDGLSKRQRKRLKTKANKRTVSAGSDDFEGSLGESQGTVVIDEPNISGPIDSRSQQQEIAKIREANRPTRNSGSPEIRISRFFDKVPTVSHEATDPVDAREAIQSPSEPTVMEEDRKIPQKPPPKPASAKQHISELETGDPKPRYRDRMTQQAVNTSLVAGKKTAAQPTNEEAKTSQTAQHEDKSSSEDELNGPVTRQDVAAPSSPSLFSDPEVSFAEPTSGDIKSKTFKHGGSPVLIPQQQAALPSKRNLQYFTVSQVYTRVVGRDCDGNNDELAYNNEDKAFEIWIDGTPMRRPSRTSEVLRYSSNHFLAVWHCDDSLRVVSRGSEDDTSTGVLLFEFGDFKSKEAFMGTLRDAFPQTKFSPSLDVKTLENRWATGLKQLQADAQKEEAVEKVMQALVLPKSPDLASTSSQKLNPDVVNNSNDTQQPQTSAQPPASSGQRQTYVIVEKQPTATRASTRVRTKPAKADNQLAEREVPIERFRLKHNIRPWEEPLTYPFQGPKRTTVNFEDLDRIDEGDLLNDNIVNFCLRKAEHEHERDVADKVFFFNTYFFSTLTTTRAGKRGFNYDAVKRWTKKVDLFSLPYVIVPINVSYHWYLTIICNLQNLPRGDVPIEEPQEVVASDAEMEEGHGQDPSSSAPAGDMPSKQFKRMSLDDEEVQTTTNGRHDADFEIPDSDDERKKQAAYESALVNSQEDLPEAEQVMTKKPKKKPAAPVRRWSPDQPLIITLDSLGAPHSQEVKLLKEYIVAEALDKRGLTIDPKQIQGITAKGIPEQTNLSDCGVFLIGYVEEFLKDPRRFVEKVCSKEMDRNNDFQGFEPREKRVEIRDILVKLSTEQRQNKEEEKQKKRDAKRKATEQAGGDVKRIASSPVKDPVEGKGISDDKVSDPGVSSPAKPSAIEMAIRGPTSILEGIGEFL
ncbi:hypothetical protein MBLNU457_g1015t1 [Dothideomycetes sp. NU457]